MSGESRELFTGKRSLQIDGGWHITSSREVTTEAEAFHVTSRATAVIHAADGVTLSCGSSFITVSANEVAISAPLIRLNSGGSALAATPPDTSAPEEPEPAEVEEG